MTAHAPIVVIGAGQAGLAVSRLLTASGLDHVVLERGRIAESWRGRWDSFCLVTPNWSVRLPGGAYDGPDPDGFMPRDEIVLFIERYAHSFGAPVREHVIVRSLAPADDGFLLDTSDGPLRASGVVVATGTYTRPHLPKGTADLPARVQVLEAGEYRRPADVAPGGVLVIGGGQTACQLADELREAGRDVVLAAGRVPWVPRRIGGRDIVHWHEDSGYFDQPRAVLTVPEARVAGNQQLTGRAGGRDLNYRTLHAKGVRIVGHLRGFAEGRVEFADDLGETIAFGDARYQELCRRVRATCDERGWPVPDMPKPQPFDTRGSTTALPLHAFGSVIVAAGFRPDYTWVRVPGAFDALGFPIEQDGASTVARGLFFCGVHFMRKRKSSLLIGVGEDAALVARGLVGLFPSRQSASR